MTNKKTAEHFYAVAKQVAETTDFVLGEEIYRGTYYEQDWLRNMIFAGTYQGKPAVLKIYDDPRSTAEPINQQQFIAHNTSKMFRAPEVYAHEMTSAHTGWYIMERLPEGGAFLSTPIADKRAFADLFLEYRTHFPTTPTRDLFLPETLPAAEFQLFCINRWFELASKKEADRAVRGAAPLLPADSFIPRYVRALEIVRSEFANRPMVWCHGHFKPQEVYRVTDTEYYLIDFAHMHLYPEGYEFGFIIWADVLMTQIMWERPYDEWVGEINEWIEAFRPVAAMLNIPRYDALMRAVMIERTIGTILADVVASDRSDEEKEQQLTVLFAYVDECLGDVE